MPKQQFEVSKVVGGFDSLSSPTDTPDYDEVGVPFFGCGRWWASFVWHSRIKYLVRHQGWQEVFHLVLHPVLHQMLPLYTGHNLKMVLHCSIRCFCFNQCSIRWSHLFCHRQSLFGLHCYVRFFIWCRGTGCLTRIRSSEPRRHRVKDALQAERPRIERMVRTSRWYF